MTQANIRTLRQLRGTHAPANCNPHTSRQASAPSRRALYIIGLPTRNMIDRYNLRHSHDRITLDIGTHDRVQTAVHAPYASRFPRIAKSTCASPSATGLRQNAIGPCQIVLPPQYPLMPHAGQRIACRAPPVQGSMRGQLHA